MTFSSVEQSSKSRRKMKKGKNSEDPTLVVKLGMEYFTTVDSPYPVCIHIFSI